jgi:ribosomal protein S18 acetylase RimI-like enzyme
MKPLIAQDSQAAASDFSTIELLRDGRRVEIRALKPTDLSGLMAAVGRISDGAMSRRFFGAKRHFSEKEIAYFVHVDFITHVALVAVAEEGTGPILAGGRYVVVRPGCAELAFAVVDDCHGLGLGTLLMRHLTAIARRAGLKEFVAEVLVANQPMLHVFERSGLRLATRRDGAVVHVTLQL